MSGADDDYVGLSHGRFNKDLLKIVIPGIVR